MKRLIFLFIASLMAHYSALAETILPFVQDGKSWVYEVSNFIYDWEETYSLEGDTVISSRNCLKLYFSCEFYNQNHLYKGAMFEEGGNVYIITPGSTTPTLLYDFSCEPGTTIMLGKYEIKIKEKKLVKYRGEYLRVIDYYLPDDEDYSFKGVEGVGYLIGGLIALVDGSVPGATGGERSLKTCTVNGEVVFDRHEFYTSSQIVTDINGVPSALHTKSDYFDLQGRKVANPQKGINIIRDSDGTSKKVLMK